MSRSATIWLAVALIALLAAFATVSMVTSNPAWILWSVVPILGVLLFVFAAIRGETLGECKRQRDVQIAERKAAERKARAAARTTGK